MLFWRNNKLKRNVAIGIDIGTSQVKAAIVRRVEDQLQLTAYGVRSLDLDVGRAGTEQQVAAELEILMSELGTQERKASVSISCNSAMVCQADFPRMPLPDVRSALKLNSSRYLRRDFANYYLDAIELDESTPGGKGQQKQSTQMKVLVGGANREEVSWYRDSLLGAKIRPDVLELSALSVINAFQVSQPEIAKNDFVLLLDIGARSTSINFLRNGLPMITRIMHFGGMQLSEYVAQMLTIDIKEAEIEKIKMSDPVVALLRQAISPLAKEVRSSIDFFERQHEFGVSKAFACGGSACSEILLNLFSDAVGVPIVRWNPIQSFETSHFNGDSDRLGELSPSLAAAVGTAVARI